MSRGRSRRMVIWFGADSTRPNGIYEVIFGLDVMPKRYPVWPCEPWQSREVRWTAYKNYNIFYAVDDAAAIVKSIVRRQYCATLL